MTLAINLVRIPKFLFIVILLLLASQVQAHTLDYVATNTTLTGDNGSIHLRMKVTNKILFNVLKKEDQLIEFDKLFARDFIIEQNGKPCLFKTSTYDNAEDSEFVSIYGSFLCDEAANIESLHI